MPRFKKGSIEAKRYMAKLRGMVGKRKTLKRSIVSPKTVKMARRRRYAKKRSWRRPGFTLPLAPIAGIIAMPDLRGGAEDLIKGNWAGAMIRAGRIIGVDNGVFNMSLLASNILPLIIGALVHKFVGGSLGINRMLGRAKVPILRI